MAYGSPTTPLVYLKSAAAGIDGMLATVHNRKLLTFPNPTKAGCMSMQVTTRDIAWEQGAEVPHVLSALGWVDASTGGCFVLEAAVLHWFMWGLEGRQLHWEERKGDLG